MKISVQELLQSTGERSTNVYTPLLRENWLSRAITCCACRVQILLLVSYTIPPPAHNMNDIYINTVCHVIYLFSHYLGYLHSSLCRSSQIQWPRKSISLKHSVKKPLYLNPSVIHLPRQTVTMEISRGSGFETREKNRCIYIHTLADLFAFSFHHDILKLL